MDDAEYGALRQRARAGHKDAAEQLLDEARRRLDHQTAHWAALQLGWPLRRQMAAGAVGAWPMLGIATGIVRLLQRRSGRPHGNLTPDGIVLRRHPDAQGDETVDPLEVLELGPPHGSGAAGSSDADATQLSGPPEYLAPELVTQSGVHAEASDVYALGCILFEALSGELPFPGDAPFQILHGHVHDEAPELPDDIDLRLRDIVRKALAKAPEDRPTLGAVRQELNDLRHSMGTLRQEGAADVRQRVLRDLAARGELDD